MARVWQGMLIAAMAALTLAPAAASAPAIGSPTPWDGINPFHCKLQDAGFGTKVPDPGADPYCVHFNKTNQNLTQLGLIQFLSLEPARVAAAAPKCFYFQEDHWRGSVIQSDGRTVLYEFIGHYFFDKARGDGGAWVTGFSIAGQTFDPTQIPGFPPAYGAYFGPGTGGFRTHDDIPTDPACVAMAQKDPRAIYAAAADAPRCVPGPGPVRRDGIAPLTLGMTEGQLQAKVGPPQTVKRGFLRYCVAHGGALLAGEPGDRSGNLGSDPRARVVMLLTSGRSSPRAHFTPIGHVGPTTVLRAGNLIEGVRHGRTVYAGCYSTRAIRSRAALLAYLRRAG